jgi:hypothetical protein
MEKQKTVCGGSFLSSQELLVALQRRLTVQAGVGKNEILSPK